MNANDARQKVKEVRAKAKSDIQEDVSGLAVDQLYDKCIDRVTRASESSEEYVEIKFYPLLPVKKLQELCKLLKGIGFDVSVWGTITVDADNISENYCTISISWYEA